MRRRGEPELPPVAVFTITYNQRERVLDLLRDLGRQDYPGELLQVIVLDDGSGDGIAAAVREAGPSLPYRLTCLKRRHEADYMSAQRWNECIAAAAAETAVFVQVDDVRVRPDFVHAHVKWHLGESLALVTGAKFEGESVRCDLDGCRRGHLAGDDGSARAFTAWTAAWGASLSYPRRLVEAVWDEPHDRPFDERMTGWGFHEVEFAYRATLADATLVYDPGAGVFHRHHGPEADHGRAIDHARSRQEGEERNAAYLLDKHGLERLPRW